MSEARWQVFLRTYSCEYVKIVHKPGSNITLASCQILIHRFQLFVGVIVSALFRLIHRCHGAVPLVTLPTQRFRCDDCRSPVRQDQGANGVGPAHKPNASISALRCAFA